MCPALPAPAGRIVEVSTATELEGAVDTLSSGTTICIADGIFDLDGIYLRIDVPAVTVRSVRRNRESVALNGNYITTEIIQVTASGVSIADITLQDARYRPIRVSPENSDTEHTVIFKAQIIDPGQ